MKLAKGDRIPIGKAKVSARFVDEGPVSDYRAAIDAGLGCGAIHQWKRRHPDSGLSQQEIIDLIKANRDQSAVAKRQGCISGGRRGRFGRMRYDQVDAGVLGGGQQLHHPPRGAGVGRQG